MRRETRIVALLAALLAVLCLILSLNYLKSSGGETPEPSASAQQSTGDASGSAQQTGAEEGAFTLYCPDVGKADAFLLQSAAGSLLIDTGEDPADVLALLRSHQVSKLDAVVLSHLDKDHIGGAAAVLEQVEVQTLYRTDREEDSAAYAALVHALSLSDAQSVTVTETLTVSAAGAELTLYPPLSPDYGKDEDNNASLIAAVEAGGVRMLFTGDALKPRVQEFLAEQYDGSDYQLLKVPHHGRETKPTALLLENFSPRYALISSSEEEPENEKLLKRLEKAGVEPLLLREGAVQLRCQDAAIERVSE